MPAHAATPVQLREVSGADRTAMLAINNSAVPAMNGLDAGQLDWLVQHAVYARVAEDASGVVAFLIALPAGVAYASANYRWFSEHYHEFLYIDRIAVAERARRLGIGSALYDDLAVFAHGRWSSLLAEVNSDPPNPISVAFHARHGFHAVGALEHTSDGTHHKSVIMFRRAIDD